MSRRVRIFLLCVLILLWAANCGQGLRRDTGTPPGESPTDVDEDDDSDGDDPSNDEPVELTSVNPTTGGRGTTITLVGSGFTSNIEVTVGGVDCGQLSVTSSTQLSCEVGAHRPTVVNIAARNPGSVAATLTNAFTYKSYLYVAEQSGEKVTGYNIASNGSLTLIGSTATGDGSSPTWLALDPRGKFVFVIQGNATSDVGIRSIPINPQTGVLGSQINEDPTGYVPAGIAVRPNGDYLVVTGNPDAGTDASFSYAINRTTGELTLADTAVSSDTSQVIASPDGKHFYGVNSDNTHPVSGKVFSLGNLTDISDDPFMGGAVATTLTISPDGNCVVAVLDGNGRLRPYTRNSSSGSLSLVSSLNISEAGGQKRLIVHPTLSLLYLLSSGPDFAEIFNYHPTACNLTTSGKTFPGLSGSGSRDLAFDSTGEFLYVTHFATDGLSVFAVDSAGDVTNSSSLNSLNGPMGVVID